MGIGHGIAADWYPDPADSRQLRYWDGSSWTQQVRDAAATMAPSAVSATVSEFTGHEPSGQNGAAYVPFSRGGAALPTTPSALRGSSSTVAIWIYALVPLLLLLHRYFGWEFSAQDLANAAVHLGLLCVTAFLALLLAGLDASQLRARGFSRTPPVILGLLPPIHVLTRIVATGPAGLLVALASLIVQAVVVLILLGAPTVALPDDTAAQHPIATEGMTAPFDEQQLAYLLTPKGMAEKIIFDASASALNYETVTCEPLLTTDLGSQTTCFAEARLSDYDIRVQVLPNGTDVPFAIVSVAPLLNR